MKSSETSTGSAAASTSTAAAVYLNAGSGSAGSPLIREQVKTALAAAGVACRIEELPPGQDATQWARQAVAQGARLVIAGGGDGTVSSIAAALAGTEAVLGVLPLGTLNHFARDLGIPESLEAAIDVIRRGQVRRIDAAEVNGRIFINNSSLGLYPHMVRHRQEQQRLGWSKWTAFFWACLAVFRRYPFVTVRVQPSAGPELVRETPLAFVGNNIYSTGSASLGRRARLDEGMLCLFVAHHRGRLGLVRLACSALLGRLDRDGALDCRRACEIRIETHQPTMLVACDGETSELKAPLHYRALPGALQVLAPE